MATVNVPKPTSSIVLRPIAISILSLVSIAACSKHEPPAPTPVPVTSATPEPAPTPTPSVVESAAPLPASSTTAPVVAAKQGAPAPPPPPSTPFVAGESWTGSYFCGGKPNTSVLRITKSTGNAVSAIFDFKTASGKAGSFMMSGVYLPDSKHLTLNAGNWIVQPAGVVSVNLDGSVSPDSHGFAGRVQGPGCSSFLVRR